MMFKLSKKQYFSTLVLLGAVLISANSLAADYPLEDKLQQCQAAFEKMHSGDLSQDEAWKVRREHKMLVKEILEDLNKRNHDILKSKDRAMSSDEVVSNLVVIGSLLEMLATENLRTTDEWGYELNK